MEEKDLQASSTTDASQTQPDRPAGSWEAGARDYSYAISWVNGTQESSLPACHLSRPSARARYQTENYALLRLSQGLCLGESLWRWVWGEDSLMPPLCSTRPPAPVSPPGLSEGVRGPGGCGYLGHRLRPSLRKAVARGRGGGAGALWGGPSPETAKSPGAARVWVWSGPPRLLKARASAPAPPLAPRRDAPQSEAVGRRPEAAGSAADPGGLERSRILFFF